MEDAEIGDSLLVCLASVGTVCRYQKHLNLFKVPTEISSVLKDKGSMLLCIIFGSYRMYLNTMWSM